MIFTFTKLTMFCISAPFDQLYNHKETDKRIFKKKKGNQDFTQQLNFAHLLQKVAGTNQPCSLRFRKH